MTQTRISWMEEDCAPYKWFRDQEDWPAVVIQKARDRFGEDIVVTDERGHGYGTICIQNPKGCSSDLCSSFMLCYNRTEDRFYSFLGSPYLPFRRWIDTREELKAAVFSNYSDVKMDHAYLKRVAEDFGRDTERMRACFKTERYKMPAHIKVLVVFAVTCFLVAGLMALIGYLSYWWR